MFYFSRNAGVPLLPVLSPGVEQASAHDVPPVGNPLHRPGVHGGLGLPRPPGQAHPPLLQHPQLAGAGHHGHVPPPVCLRGVQLPAADVLLLLHGLLQVLHGPGPLHAGHHHLPHGGGHLHCRHHRDRPLQTEVKRNFDCDI